MFWSGLIPGLEIDWANHTATRTGPARWRPGFPGPVRRIITVKSVQLRRDELLEHLRESGFPPPFTPSPAPLPPLAVAMTIADPVRVVVTAPEAPPASAESQLAASPATAPVNKTPKQPPPTEPKEWLAWARVEHKRRDGQKQAEYAVHLWSIAPETVRRRWKKAETLRKRLYDS
jgi:hypothetical protein